MNYEKAVRKELKKCVKENKGCEVKIKAIVVTVDEKEEILTLNSCPPSGCTTCPPIC